MTKYKLNIKAQSFEFYEIKKVREKAKALIELGVWLIETDAIEEKIAPIKIEDNEEEEVEEKKEVVKQKRKRRTKEEMASDGEQTKEKSLIGKRKVGKYPEEMKVFIRENMEENSNKELCEMINQQWDVEITKMRLASYMKYNDLRRETGNNQFRHHEKIEEKEKMVPKKPIKDPFDLTINGEKVPLEIMQYVKERKDWEDHIKLRDEIIMMFEKNYNSGELRSMQSQFKEKKLVKRFEEN